MRCLGEWAEARGLKTTDGQGLVVCCLPGGHAGCHAHGKQGCGRRAVLMC